MTKGERLARLRQERGFTQSELAKLLHTTKQTISKYEKNIVTNIPSDRVEDLSRILGTTPEYIMGWEEAQKNNDAISDIIIRLRSDDTFLSAVKILYDYDDDKLSSLLAFLK